MSSPQPRTPGESGQGEQRSRTRSLVLALAVCVLAPVLLILGAFGAVKAFDIDGSDAATFPTYAVADVFRGQVAWTAPAGSTGERYGWHEGQVLAYADKDAGRVIGLDSRTGLQRWTIWAPAPKQPDAQLDRICAVTPRAFQHLVAIAYQRDQTAGRTATCSGLMLLDLRTGKVRWEASLTKQVVPVLAFAAGRVVVADTGLTAYGLDSAEPLWSNGWERSDSCQMVGVGGSAKVLVAAASCGPLRQHQAWTFDPETGLPLTRTALGQRATKPAVAVAQVVSADPIVIAYPQVDAESRDAPQVFSTLTDDHSTVRTSIQLPARTRYEQGSPTVVVTGRRLVLAGDDGRVSCYDLHTGRLNWVRTDLAPDGHAEEVSSGRAFLAGSDGKVAYGVVADLSGRTGVFGVDLASSVLTMISPPLRTPFRRTTPPEMFLAGRTLYGINSGDQYGAAFAVN